MSSLRDGTWKGYATDYTLGMNGDKKVVSSKIAFGRG